MTLVAIATVIGIVWVIIGALLGIAAGLTWNFKERHFEPVWMLLLGPLGIVAWRISENREERRNK